MAMSDSGTTGHYMCFEDCGMLTDLVKLADGIEVEMANGTVIKATHSGKLKIPQLKGAAREAFVFPDLHCSLLSTALFCDSDLKVEYNQKKVIVYDYSNNIILEGTRNNHLWFINLERTTLGCDSVCNQVIKHKNNADFVRYISLALGAPTNSTLINAVEKRFVEVDGLTVKMIRDNLPNSVATSKGHLNLSRQGVRSTKRTLVEPEGEETQDDQFPLKQMKKERTVVHASTVHREGHLFVDSSGRFPYKSNSDTQYILVMFAEDPNYIHFEPMSSRTAASYTEAYRRGYEFFESRQIDVHFNHIDNETSAELERYLKRKQAIIQFVPPGNHRSSKAERMMQTAKNHIISCLCTADDSYPTGEWDRVIEFAEITVNLLRGSAINPAISAYQQVHGKFDWNATPLAPFGTKVVIHETPIARGSWDPHGVDGWSISPAMRHYRCQNVLTRDTLRIRITDTVAWHPKAFVLPGGSPIEIFNNTIDNLIDSIKQISKVNYPQLNERQLIPRTATLTDALLEFRKIFHEQSIETIENSSTSHQVTEVTEITSAEGNKQLTLSTAPVQRVLSTGGTSGHDKEPGNQNVAGTNSDHSTLTQRLESPSSTPIILADETVDVQRVLAESQQSGAKTTPNSDNNLATHNDKAPQEPKAAKRIQRPVREKRTPTQYKCNKAVVNVSPTVNKKLLIQQKLNISYNNKIKRLSSSKRLFKCYTAVDMDNTNKPLTYKTAIKGVDKEQWLQAHVEELERLLATGSEFVHRRDVPADYSPAYYNPQLKTKIDSNGKKTFRVRGTIGGDKVEYTGDVSASTADMTTIKLLFNAVASEKDSKLMTLDIKDFYLGTILDSPEWMRIHESQIPVAFLGAHPKLTDMCSGGYYYMKITQGIYGLPQAGRLAQQKLVKHLELHGYVLSDHTACLFTHKTRNVKFTLVVDDFAVKYHKEEDAEHLIAALQEIYVLKVNWAGDKYVGMTIEIDKVNNTVTTSVPNYVQQALKRFGVINAAGEDSPLPYSLPKYGAHTQYAIHDDSKKLPPERVKRLQQIVGVFMWYARITDLTMQPAISIISSMQAQATEKVEELVNHFLQYASRYPNAKLIYKASDMKLKVHSDASYLGESEARSRAGGIHFLGNNADDNFINAPINAISRIIPAIVASAGEAEYATVFMNAQEAEPIRDTLKDLGYEQQTTTIVSDNMCAVGLANNTVKQKRSKAIDMRFHWIRDRVKNKHFKVIWEPGHTNLADFFTKVVPVKKHLEFKKLLVHSLAQGKKYEEHRINKATRANIYLMRAETQKEI